MLIHYFAGADVGKFSESIGEDYGRELLKYPAWAITKARHWWLSELNPRRGRKPVPGDWAACAKVEMAVVRIAESRIARSRPKQTAPATEQRPKPKYNSDALIAKAGLRRMNA
ncbi:MAG: hypothetical protein COB08_019425 [Rhodobacteraceae bacterium]|nr:hypothetical protein [Paracoccaceae bacterium]